MYIEQQCCRNGGQGGVSEKKWAHFSWSRQNSISQDQQLMLVVMTLKFDTHGKAMAKSEAKY